MESTLQKPAFVAANTTPKATTIVYWIITALFCLQMSFTAYAQLRLPQVARRRILRHSTRAPACGVRAANDPVGWLPRGSIPLPLGGLDGARPEICFVIFVRRVGVLLAHADVVVLGMFLRNFQLRVLVASRLQGAADL